MNIVRVGTQTKAIEFRCAYVLEWNRKLFNSIPELEWGNGFAVGAVWYVTLFEAGNSKV